MEIVWKKMEFDIPQYVHYARAEKLKTKQLEFVDHELDRLILKCNIDVEKVKVLITDAKHVYSPGKARYWITLSFIRTGESCRNCNWEVLCKYSFNVGNEKKVLKAVKYITNVVEKYHKVIDVTMYPQSSSATDLLNDIKKQLGLRWKKE